MNYRMNYNDWGPDSPNRPLTPAQNLQGFSAIDLSSPVSAAINLLKVKLFRDNLRKIVSIS